MVTEELLEFASLELLFNTRPALGWADRGGSRRVEGWLVRVWGCLGVLAGCVIRPGPAVLSPPAGPDLSPEGKSMYQVLSNFRNSYFTNSTMFASRRLLQACRITLFTRDNCSLCTTAKDVLSRVGSKRPFVFATVDLARPESRPWRELYDFDIPVVSFARQRRASRPDPRADSHQQGRCRGGGCGHGRRGSQINAPVYA